jgi:hypothetical protein
MKLSFLEKLWTIWNTFWFFIRRSLKFKRKGYSEATVVEPVFSPEALAINEMYAFTTIGRRLSAPNWHRNLATLWYLEEMLGDLSWPGCQNFARLPSLTAFFKKRAKQITITGIELDAFVPLKGFHSLWDHAQYYISLQSEPAYFLDQDFFKYESQSEVIVCFYPFVSAAPALAWGLPASMSGPELWIKAFERNLKPKGYVFVVHQGDWEEADFDAAREKSTLKLIRRKELKCPFFSTKYPAHGSLYQKST